jgi:predicted ATPase
MLSRLRLTNFKSWADTGDIAIKPITGFFGPNSSGKTSLLQALLLLKQTADSADRGLALQFGDRTSLANLGDFRSLIHHHAEDAELRLALDWERKKPFMVWNLKERYEQVVRDTRIGFSTRIQGENGGGGKRSG